MSKAMPVLRSKVKVLKTRFGLSLIVGLGVGLFFMATSRSGLSRSIERAVYEFRLKLPSAREYAVATRETLLTDTETISQDLLFAAIAAMIGTLGASFFLKSARDKVEEIMEDGEYIEGHRKITFQKALDTMHEHQKDPLRAHDYKPSPYDLTLSEYQSSRVMRIPSQLGAGHHIMLGASGGGKSRLIKSFISQMRPAGTKAVIMDPDGLYLSEFYRPGDRVISIFDKRADPYSFWNESGIDYLALSTSLIETRHGSGGQEFFSESPQSLFAGLLRVSEAGGLDEIKEHLYRPDIETLQKSLSDKNEVSAAFLSDPKLAANVMASLAVKLYWLKYLNYWPDQAGKTNPLSLTKWARDDQDDSWIFLVAAEVDWAASYHFLRMCFDLVAMGCFGRGDYPGRRPVAAICDEISKIGVLSQLEPILSRGRKDGLSLYTGLQHISQFNMLYGEHKAKTILDSFQNKWMFKTDSTALTDYMASATGLGKWKRSSEQISSEGVISVSSVIEERTSFPKHTFGELRPGEFVVKLSGINPFKTAIEHKGYQKVAEGSERDVPNI